jgi:hypothetical protein
MVRKAGLAPQRGCPAGDPALPPLLPYDRRSNNALALRCKPDSFARFIALPR